MQELGEGTRQGGRRDTIIYNLHLLKAMLVLHIAIVLFCKILALALRIREGG